jgi:hypothetical protein
VANNWLKDYGFNVVRLPRRDLRPGDVLRRTKGSFDEKVGALAMVFTSDEDQPQPSVGEPVAGIGRTIEKKVETKLGLRVLGALLGAGAASKLGIDLEAKRATNLAVTYEDVDHDSIAVLELDAWIQAARSKLTGQSAIWLNGDQLAAVTAVLRTSKLSIVAERSNGASIDLSIPDIEGIIGGQAGAGVESTSGTKVTFTGPDAIAFGFQAYVMKFEGNVSFGLDEVRGPEEEPGAEPESEPWTEVDDIELGEGELPED